MRRRLLRYLLPALLAAFSAVPAAANPIVGSFYYQQDWAGCDPPFDDTCRPLEQFGLDNSTYGDFAELIFSGVIFIDNIPYDYQFDVDLIPGPDLLAMNGSVLTLGLVPPAFTDPAQVKLSLKIENPALYPGKKLGLSPFRFDTDPLNQLIFTADVEVVDDDVVAVPESPSWLVVGIALSALAVGRALFS